MDLANESHSTIGIPQCSPWNISLILDNTLAEEAGYSEPPVYAILGRLSRSVDKGRVTMRQNSQMRVYSVDSPPMADMDSQTRVQQFFGSGITTIPPS